MDGAPTRSPTWPPTASALLDHLGIESAHVVGASMGGMIAQTMAIEHPTRVRTLTSIMSTTGEPEYGAAHARGAGAARAARRRPPGTRPSKRAWQSSKVIGSPEHFDEDVARRSAGGGLRPVLQPRRRRPASSSPILASGSRAEGLARARRAHRRDPRRRRPARHPQRRAAHRRAGPRRRAAHARGHGPRPAARRAAVRSSTPSPSLAARTHA